MVHLYVFLALASPGGGTWTLKDGSLVSFLFVANQDGVTAWRPDGTDVGVAGIPKLIHPMPNPSFGTELEAFIRPQKEAETLPSVRFQFPGKNQESATSVAMCMGRHIWKATIAPPAGFPAKQDVAIGVAEGAWTESGYVAFGQPKGTQANKVADRDKGSEGRWGPVKRQGIPTPPVITTAYLKGVPSFTVVFSAIARLKNSDLRYIAIDVKGASMPLLQSFGERYTFMGELRSVGWIQLQTRPYEWKTVKAANFIRTRRSTQ